MGTPNQLAAVSPNCVWIMGLDIGSISPGAGRKLSCSCAAGTRVASRAILPWRKTGDGNGANVIAEKITTFDTAIYLKTDSDIAEYLATAFETNDPDDVTHALATIARARGVTGLSRKSGVARGTLNKAIGEGANPTLGTLLSLMAALEMNLTVKPKATTA